MTCTPCNRRNFCTFLRDSPEYSTLVKEEIGRITDDEKHIGHWLTYQAKQTDEHELRICNLFIQHLQRDQTICILVLEVAQLQSLFFNTVNETAKDAVHTQLAHALTELRQLRDQVKSTDPPKSLDKRLTM